MDGPEIPCEKKWKCSKKRMGAYHKDLEASLKECSHWLNLGKCEHQNNYVRQQVISGKKGIHECVSMISL